MTFKNPHLLTKLEIWAPKYHTESGEYEVWLHKGKVYRSTPYILVEFTKAKHLMGQRFCISRNDAQKGREVTNGKATCLALPISKFESWDTVEEIKQKAEELWPTTQN